MEFILDIPDEMISDLETIAMINDDKTALGERINALAIGAVSAAIRRYQSYDENGERHIRTERGIYIPSKLDRAAGKTETPCWIIAETAMFDTPYCTIVMDGEMYKVPADRVRKG